MVIVNNTGANIDLFIPAFTEFSKTGVLVEDIEDLFSVEKIIVDDEVRIIVEFLDDYRDIS